MIAMKRVLDIYMMHSIIVLPKALNSRDKKDTHCVYRLSRLYRGKRYYYIEAPEEIN